MYDCPVLVENMSSNGRKHALHNRVGVLAKVDKSGGELGELSGTIKSYSHWKKYGFIENDEHGDVFLHGDQIRGYKVGQTVKFTGIRTKDAPHCTHPRVLLEKTHANMR